MCQKLLSIAIQQKQKAHAHEHYYYEENRGRKNGREKKMRGKCLSPLFGWKKNMIHIKKILQYSGDLTPPQFVWIVK